MTIIYVTKNLTYKKLRNRNQRLVIFISSKRRSFEKIRENAKSKVVHISFVFLQFDVN